MITTLYLDSRSRAKQGFPLKIYGKHNGKVMYIPLGIFLETNQWDSVNNMVVRHPRTLVLNRLVSNYWSMADQIILNLQMSGALDSMSTADLKERIMLDLGLKQAKAEKVEAAVKPEKPKKEGDFKKKWFEFTQSRRTDGTQDFYYRTWKAMLKFDPSLPFLSFDDINKEWLQRFDTWLGATHCQNSKAIHYRNIRAVFNDAIDDELTTNYPFRRFKIRTEETRHRNLSVEELRALINAPQTSKNLRNEREYIDLFTLSFLLCGINLVDMRDMKIVRGRVEYRRAKTHKLYDVKLEPEAAAIIEKYSGGKHTINIFDRFTDYQQLNRQINRGIRSVGRPTGKQSKVLGVGPFDGVSYYWARHTWASIASEIDIPYDVIAHALGHGQRTVTDIYINFNQKKIDDANRKVIDYVYYGKDYRKVRA